MANKSPKTNGSTQIAVGKRAGKLLAPRSDRPRNAYACEPPQTRHIPAWLLSVCVHLALLILLAVGIRAPRPHGLSESDRGVGIALVQHNEESVEYFNPMNMDERTEEAMAADLDAHATALPSADALSEIKLLELPLPSVARSVPRADLIPELEYAPMRRGGQPSADDIQAAHAADALMQQRQTGRGPVTDISLFGSTSAVGNSFVFVVDRSDSMGRSGLGMIALARREFKRALRELEPVHQFQIVAYNHQVVFFGGRRYLIAATEPNKKLVGQFMSGLAAFGATNHFAAIMAALNRQPDVVFLLTDGGEPPLSHPQIVQILRKARGRTTIHCIQFGKRSADGEDTFLHRLARESGGSYRYVNVTKFDN